MALSLFAHGLGGPCYGWELCYGGTVLRRTQGGASLCPGLSHYAPLGLGSPLWEWGMDSLFLQFDSLSSRKFCLPPGRARRKAHPIKRVAAPFYGRRSNGSQPRSTGGERTGRSPVLRTVSRRVSAPLYGRRADGSELTGAKKPVPKLRRKEDLGIVAKAGLEPATHGL